jgi:hypothetical protein
MLSLHQAVERRLCRTEHSGEGHGDESGEDGGGPEGDRLHVSGIE